MQLRDAYNVFSYATSAGVVNGFILGTCPKNGKSVIPLELRNRLHRPAGIPLVEHEKA